jgi:F0F1-type ATP synthase epsilon subunit
LAEEAIPVGDIDKAAAEARLDDAKAALTKAEEDPETGTAAADRELKAAEAMVAAIPQH